MKGAARIYEFSALNKVFVNKIRYLAEKEISQCLLISTLQIFY
jgi:hypothetical protein